MVVAFNVIDAPLLIFACISITSLLRYGEIDHGALLLYHWSTVKDRKPTQVATVSDRRFQIPGQVDGAFPANTNKHKVRYL
jgi:hypothetical protein